VFLRLLKKAVPLPELDAYERYLFIGPHPDDIEMGCAPTVKRLAEAGKTVHFVVATDGSMGSADPDKTGPSLAKLRQEEAQASAKFLGAQEPIFLPFRDAGFYSVDDLSKALAVEIVRLKPDIVFASDPDLACEFHFDHIKTGQAAKAAVFMTAHEGIMRSMGISGKWQVNALAFYYTDRPNTFYPVKKWHSIRTEALKLHPSQFDSKLLHDVTKYFDLRSRRYGLKALKGRCDAFRLYGTSHIHCFPEAMEY